LAKTDCQPPELPEEVEVVGAAETAEVEDVVEVTVAAEAVGDEAEAVAPVIKLVRTQCKLDP
jgi:hypothetical protein